MSYGKMPPKEVKVDKGYPIYTGYRVSGFSKKYLYKNPMLVVVARGVGGTGDVKISPAKSWITNLSIVCDLKDEVVDQKFLCELLTLANLKDKLDSGSAQSQITINALSAFKINLPPLPTQKKIAGILSAYDDLIENNLKRIKLLEELAQITYEEWFVRMRFPGHETTPVNPDTGLPEGWEKKKLKELGDVITGKTPSTSNQDFYGSKIAFVKTPDMSGKTFVISSEQMLSQEGANSQKNKLLPEKSLMVSCIGTAGVVALSTIPSQTNQQINSIVFNDGKYIYLTYLFAKGLKPLLEALGSNGATMTNVNKGKFETIEITVPDEKILSKFHKKVSPNFDSILILMKQNQSLKEARDILLPRLMTGMIDVEDYDPSTLLKEAA
jgi:type I restriction enzyme S subunit